MHPASGRHPVLERAGYNKALTAQILNIPRTTLWRKLMEYKIG